MDQTNLSTLLSTIAKLRAPDGCPWDKEQTHQSLRKYLIEETYETIDVLDQIHSPADLKKPELKRAFIDEWGDVLLQILLNAQIASESDETINFAAICQHLNDKMIRRHPHVFGGASAHTSDEVVKNWAQIKEQEKPALAQAKVASVFDQFPKSLPALPRTLKTIEKVTKVGFQWPNLDGPTAKLQEEVDELKEVLQTLPHDKDAIQSELGDVLFSVCNIASFFKLDPETALRGTLLRFENRFRHVEAKLAAAGKTPSDATLAEMDKHWDEAKQIEKRKP